MTIKYNILEMSHRNNTLLTVGKTYGVQVNHFTESLHETISRILQSLL
jgi:hypothetical protein